MIDTSCAARSSLSDPVKCQAEKQCEFESLATAICVVRAAAHLVRNLLRGQGYPQNLSLLARSLVVRKFYWEFFK
jgi:hypothetical protein